VDILIGDHHPFCSTPPYLEQSSPTHIEENGNLTQISLGVVATLRSVHQDREYVSFEEPDLLPKRQL
jgi:hypothetical protein